MKKLILLLTLLCCAFVFVAPKAEAASGRAPAAEDFALAKSVVDALSSGTYQLKYRQNPANVVPITVYSAKDGMVVSFSEKQPQVRNLYRDDSLYVISDTARLMDVHQGRASSPIFGRGPYSFAGRGEETEGDKTLHWEKAALNDGITLRFLFAGSSLNRIELLRPNVKGTHFFITGFSARVNDRLFDVPPYEVRKSLQQLKEEAKAGKMPDNPADRMAVQLMLEEEARKKK